MDKEMVDGMRVLVKLSGEEFVWYEGIVVKAKKQWVGILPHAPDTDSYDSIADESNIIDWIETRKA